MPKSMTGFARAEVKQDWGTLTCELKSVNHRFLDMYFRLPESLRELEIEFRNRIKNALARGKVECSVQFQIGGNKGASLTLNKEKAEQIIAVCEELSPQLNNAAPIDALKVLEFPGVLLAEDIDAKLIQSAALEALSKALESLTDIRQREGDEMGAVVQRRVESLREHTEQLNKIFPELKAALENKLKTRLQELEIEVDPDRLEQEIVMLAQKLDIDEEIDRLRTHLDEIERVLNSNEPIGRRLDFLMQELNREANTVGSKSQAIQSTNTSVEMKVLIEQIREQIQNIE